ncbi:MAG: thiolase family protein [Betaproteobacteria bacterium]
MKTSQTTAIVGVGQSEFKRRHEKALETLIVEACQSAIADSGLPLAEIDGLITTTGQPPIDEIAAGCGLMHYRYKSINGYTPGSSALAALVEARLAIQAGLAKSVLVFYGIKTSRPGGPYAFHAADPLKADLEMPVGYYGQPVYLAAVAQRYKHEYGLASEQLGSIAVAQRAWASMTPGAQKSDPMTMRDYLAAPFISEPLRSPDCCLISDGAGAVIVTSLERARDLPNPPIKIAGLAAGSNPWTLTEMFTQSPDFTNLGPGLVADQAFEEAGVTRGDVKVAQIYDCFTISVILQIESLGFCKKGEGASFVADGRTGPGGEFPVNTNGGHLSHAYIPAMTLTIEGVLQARGHRGEAQIPNADVSLVSCFGGPDHATLILMGER